MDEATVRNLKWQIDGQKYRLTAVEAALENLSARLEQLTAPSSGSVTSYAPYTWAGTASTPFPLPGASPTLTPMPETETTTESFKSLIDGILDECEKWWRSWWDSPKEMRYFSALTLPSFSSFLRSTLQSRLTSTLTRDGDPGSVDHEPSLSQRVQATEDAINLLCARLEADEAKLRH